MGTRRLSAFAIAALLTLMLAIPAAAQDEGFTVTVTLTTCMVTGTASSATIATTANESGVGRDCIDGWPEDGNLTLNGEPPSESASAVLTWTNVPAGAASFDAYTGQLTGGEIEVTGDVTLAATYYQFEAPGDGEPTAAPTEDATEAEADDASTSDEADGDSDDVSLPNTGSGQGSTSVVPAMALVMLGFGIATGAFALRLRSRE